MTTDILVYTFLLSFLPLGGAKTGIPFAIYNDVPYMIAFSVCLLGNVLIYPILMWLVDLFNSRLMKKKWYKRRVVRMSQLAKKGVGPKITRWGFWGLLIFVGIPLPGASAYTGTIAAIIFKIGRRDAFRAISLGAFISCLIVLALARAGSFGFSMFGQ